MEQDDLARLFVPCPDGTARERSAQRARLVEAGLAPLTRHPEEWDEPWVVLAAEPPEAPAPACVGALCLPGRAPSWSGMPFPVATFAQRPTLAELATLVGTHGAALLPEVDEDLLLASGAVGEELVLLVQGLRAAEGLRAGAAGVVLAEAWLAPEGCAAWLASTEQEPDAAVRTGFALQNLVERHLEPAARRAGWGAEARLTALCAIGTEGEGAALEPFAAELEALVALRDGFRAALPD